MSSHAISLLQACITGDNPCVNPSNIEAYRELVAAGMMYAVSGFVGGAEAGFRFTEAGWNRRHDLPAQAAGLP